MWSVAVTKRSKNRQVRRAVSRKACASISDTGSWLAPRGDRLTQRATAGEAIQSAANGATKAQAKCPESPAITTAAAAMTSAPAIRR